MKKALSLLLGILMAFSALSAVPVYAAPEDDYAFDDVGDGTVEISRYTGSDTTILIPAKLDGKPVVSIGDMAFYMLDVYGDVYIMNVTMPVSLKTIGVSAFDTNSNLRYVTLNEGLETIGDNAFDFCPQLQSINIPSTVTHIGNQVFANDENLRSITVAEGNKNYYSDGKVLYNNDRTVLIKYPAADTDESYTVAYTVTKIDSYSFAMVKNLKTLNLPASITEISADAFSDYTAETEINFGGTQEEWQALISGINNDKIKNATVNYQTYPECKTHTLDEGVVTKNPSCSEEGETTYTCIVCGAKETEKIDKTAHTPVTDEAVPPTCTEAGKTEGSHCSVCNEVITAQESVEPLNHDLGEWIVTTPAVEAKCTEKGKTAIETRYCSRCDYSETRGGEDVEALNHDLGDWTVTTPAVEAKCTEKGKTAVETRYCSRCDYSETRGGEDVEPLNHDLGEWIVTTPAVEAKCTEKGKTAVETRYCSRCDYSETRGGEDVEPLNHDLGEWIVTTPAVEAKCTEKGKTAIETRYCSRCDYSETRGGEDTEALGHDFGEWKETKAPTCTENGIETRYCSRCDATETRETAPTGKHTVVTDKAVPATFKKKGLTKGAHCSVCGEVIVAQKAVAKLGKPRIIKLVKGKKKVTVKWKKVKNIDGYFIQYGTDKTLKKRKTVKIKNPKKVKKLIKKLKSGKKYYFRVKAYKIINGKRKNSKWCKIKSVKVK